MKICCTKFVIQIFTRFLYFVLLNIHRWFNITNIIPPSPADGSLEPKRYSVDFASQRISPSTLITLLSIFSIDCQITLHYLFPYIYIYIYNGTHTNIYIYIYMERERQRKTEEHTDTRTGTHTHTHTRTYIYIYIYIYNVCVCVCVCVCITTVHGCHYLTCWVSARLNEV